MFRATWGCPLFSRHTFSDPAWVSVGGGGRVGEGDIGEKKELQISAADHQLLLLHSVITGPPRIHRFLLIPAYNTKIIIRGNGYPTNSFSTVLYVCLGLFANLCLLAKKNDFCLHCAPVLRIRDVYPGSDFFIPDPGSGFFFIPDPHQRI
jgi:hypothetical protein